MVEKTYKGEIKARVIDLRFAYSGKVSFVSKKKGDFVKKLEAVAGLEKKTFQAELDKQLSDFERVRAEFEIFNLQKGEPSDDITKYLKTEKQAQLNISVKEVELAKSKLDQADLISPVEGIIIEDNDIVPGINISPASNPIIVLETASYFFEFEIEQSNLQSFKESVDVRIKIADITREIPGTTRKVISSLQTKPGKFLVIVDLQDKTDLLLGMQGEVKL